MLFSSDPHGFFEKFFDLIEADDFQIKMLRKKTEEFGGEIVELGNCSVANLDLYPAEEVILSISFEDKKFQILVAPKSVITEKTIKIFSYYMEKQQRKKTDGGGFEMVEVQRLSLILANTRILKEEEERKEKERAEIARKYEERRVAEEVALQKRKETLLTGILDVFNGAKFKGIEIGTDDLGYPSVSLSFDNGEVLNISLGGGDIYDAHLNVNGIDTDSYEKDTFF